MKIHKNIFAFVLLIFVVILSGCTSSESSNESQNNKDDEAVKILFPTHYVGTHPVAPYIAGVVNQFNEKYKGQYEVVIEEVPGDDGYVQKLKLWNATDNFPPIILLGRDASTAKVIIENDKILDLKPFIEASPEWKSTVTDDSLKYNTVNGKVVGAPAISDRYIAMFYNKEYFEKAGIDQFPTTWEEFWDACQKLQAAGITPVSLNTQGDGWTTGLIHEAMIASKPGGLEFLSQKFPTNFENDFFIETSKDIAKLFSYSTTDAIGADVNMSLNNFISGKTAMVANGPWFIAQMSDPKSAPEGFVDKVGVALFPGDTVVSLDGSLYGYAITKGHPEEVVEGAAEFLKFESSPEIQKQKMIMLGGIAPNVELSDEEIAKLSRLDTELRELVNSQMKQALPLYQTNWATSVIHEAIPKQLPQLVLGEITAEEYAKILEEAAKKFEQSTSGE
ncbi:ABC transporter substrate-binding protein [Bacillus sp. Marseille-P3661]|uniref:ABC transporter substrate-binding protein n=1 Tax=Bacillus sp. Marseille-P3661 TaxID=1936234 RepID=UPI000C81A6D4|nr:extracellular solute-binding protein [Bacillus sp. Marseille-P3661]